MASNTLLIFFRISTLLHIRLSFGIVRSIIIYSAISKITVRPREIGTGVSWNRGNIKSRQRGPRICFLQPDLSLTEWVTLSARVCAQLLNSESLLPIRSHGEYYLKVPLRVLVKSTSRVSPMQASSVVSRDPLLAWTFYCSSGPLSTEQHGHCIAQGDMNTHSTSLSPLLFKQWLVPHTVLTTPFSNFLTSRAFRTGVSNPKRVFRTYGNIDAN
jgi:hypothetical protein